MIYLLMTEQSVIQSGMKGEHKDMNILVSCWRSRCRWGDKIVS